MNIGIETLEPIAPTITELGKEKHMPAFLGREITHFYE